MGGTLKGKWAIFRGWFNDQFHLVKCVSNKLGVNEVYVEFDDKSRSALNIARLEFLPDELQGESWETVKLYIAL